MKDTTTTTTNDNNSNNDNNNNGFNVDQRNHISVSSSDKATSYGYKSVYLSKDTLQLQVSQILSPVVS